MIAIISVYTLCYLVFRQWVGAVIRELSVKGLNNKSSADENISSTCATSGQHWLEN